MLESLFVKIFQQDMSLSQRNLIKGVPIDLKLNKLELSGNTTEFITLPTDEPTLTSIYIVLCIRDGICQNLSF